jgi:U3 small nucleolar RNA-associated protein 22
VSEDLLPLGYVRIIPAAPAGYFPDTKLQPHENSVRSRLSGHSTVAEPPTPFYNATIVVDSSFSSYQKLLRSTAQRVGGFADACMLGRTWLQQRGLGGGISHGGFGHCEWAILSALLLIGGGPKGQPILAPGYNSYQLFKTVLRYLASNDLMAHPAIFQAPDFRPTLTQIPMLYDGTRGHNVLFKMTPWSYAMLRDEASSSLSMLNDVTSDHFDATFILRKDNLLQQYDRLLRVPLSHIPGQRSSDPRIGQQQFALELYALLKEGLTDRVVAIHPLLAPYPTWPVKSAGPGVSSDMLVGFIYDAATVGRVVDHGPPAEDAQESARFQKFWGSKSELRRFKDGSILETLVWSEDHGSSVFEAIVRFILGRHLGEDVNSEAVFIDYGMPELQRMQGHDEGYDTLRTAFNVLEQDLRRLTDVPLQLKQCSPIDSKMSYTSLQPPSFYTGYRDVSPAEAVIIFEGSGRWPDDILALQRTKTAFLLKVASSLEDAVSGLATRLCLENPDRSWRNCSFLDVLYPSGAAFRLRIYIDREQTLLERQIKGQEAAVTTREELLSARSALTRTYVQLPLHTQVLVKCCTRYPVLSATVRLTKKWFYAHLLSEHVTDEVIELIVMHVFLHPHPWRVPSSALTGFWRVLQLISRWDWRRVPLIVDSSGSLTAEDVARINTRFTAWRTVDPAMNRGTLFVASTHDQSGTAFTDMSPSKVVASRMTALARSAWRQAQLEQLKLDMRVIFKPSLTDFDFILHLRSDLVPGKGGVSDKTQRFKNLRLQSSNERNEVGCNVVQLFLADLELRFGTTVVLFHDRLTHSVITGLWKPQPASRPLKINLSYNTKPASSTQGGGTDGEVQVNREAILSDIARLGGDLVTRIVVRGQA